jgi:hypothetical protein
MGIEINGEKKDKICDRITKTLQWKWIYKTW